jgi:hypothetical protein
MLLQVNGALFVSEALCVVVLVSFSHPGQHRAATTADELIAGAA